MHVYITFLRFSWFPLLSDLIGIKIQTLGFIAINIRADSTSNTDITFILIILFIIIKFDFKSIFFLYYFSLFNKSCPQNWNNFLILIKLIQKFRHDISFNLFILLFGLFSRVEHIILQLILNSYRVIVCKKYLEN